MTKSELLEMLKDYPDDTLIVVNGHSDGSGYDDVYDVDSLDIVKYKKNKHSSWRGTYCESSDLEKNPNFASFLETTVIKAIVIR